MYCGLDFDPQEFNESRVLGFDLINDLNQGEILMSSTWTVAVSAGVDPNPSNCMEGPSFVVVPLDSEIMTGTIQRIGRVQPGVTYILRAEVITTRGNVVSLWSHIRGVAAVT